MATECLTFFFLYQLDFFGSKGSKHTKC